MHFWVGYIKVSVGKQNLHENERCFPITLIIIAAFRVTFVSAAIVFCSFYGNSNLYGEVGEVLFTLFRSALYEVMQI